MGGPGAARDVQLENGYEPRTTPADRCRKCMVRKWWQESSQMVAREFANAFGGIFFLHGSGSARSSVQSSSSGALRARLYFCVACTSAPLSYAFRLRCTLAFLFVLLRGFLTANADGARESLHC